MKRCEFLDQCPYKNQAVLEAECELSHTGHTIEEVINGCAVILSKAIYSTEPSEYGLPLSKVRRIGKQETGFVLNKIDVWAEEDRDSVTPPFKVNRCRDTLER